MFTPPHSRRQPFPCSGRSLACPELRRARPEAGRDRCLWPQRRSCARPLGFPGTADLPIGSWVFSSLDFLPVALASRPELRRVMPTLWGYGPNQKHPVILSNAKDLNPRVLPPPFLHAPAASLFLVAPASCRLSGFLLLGFLLVALAFMPAPWGYRPDQKHAVILSNAKDLNPRALPPPFLHAPAASLFLVAPASCRLSGFPGSPISRSALGFLPVALAFMPALRGYGPNQKHPVILSNAKDLNPRVLPPPFLHVLHAPASSLFLVAPASCRLPGFLLFGILLVALAFMPAPWGYRPDQKHAVILSNAKDLNRRVLPPSFQHAPAVCLSPLRSPLLSAHSAVIFFLRLPR